MKIRRIPKAERPGMCDDCHNRAELEIDFGQKRELMRLCLRCGRYLGGVILSRIGEAEQGVPIPQPGQRLNTQVSRPQQVVTQRPSRGS